MKSVFGWFIANPHLYYVAGLTMLLSLAAFAIGSSKMETLRRKAEWLFLGLAGGTVLVWRLPVLLWPQPMNIDEGQWAACALKATKDLAPWRRFDAVFIDAVAPNAFGYNNRATEGIESFPALAAFITENYLLKEEVLGVRLYILKSANLPPKREN